MAAYRSDHTLFISGLLKPFAFRQQPEQFEQNGAGDAGSGQVGDAASVGISGPYSDNILGSKPDGPRITRSVTGPCFPGDVLCGTGPSPIHFVGTNHFAHRLKRTIQGDPIVQRKARITSRVPIACRHFGIARCNLHQCNLGSAQNQGKTIFIRWA